MERSDLLPAFDWLAEYLVRAKGWEPEQARGRVHECRLFLTACARSEKDLAPPTAECDDVWHAFILHTREYREYCLQHVGHFVEHSPASPGERLDPRPAARAMTLLEPGWRWSGSADSRCRKPPAPDPIVPICKNTP
jgi:hypothetical protein